MQKSWVLPIACLCITAAAGVSRGDPKPTSPDNPDWKGKVLFVTTHHPGVAGGLLEKVEVRYLGKQPFLVGRYPNIGKPGDPYNGVTTWVPITEITMILEFDTLEQAQKLLAASSNKQEGKSVTPP